MSDKPKDELPIPREGEPYRFKREGEPDKFGQGNRHTHIVSIIASQNKPKQPPPPSSSNKK